MVKRPKVAKGSRRPATTEPFAPFAPFDTVTQCRQHAFRPDGADYPAPLGWHRVGLRSPCGHWCRFVHACHASRSFWLSRVHFPASLPSARLCFPRLTMASGSQPNRLPATCSTTKALTPATVHPGGRSPRLSRYTFPTFRLQPRGVLRHRFTRQLQRTGRVSDFAMNEQARRHTPPNRVRHPADRQFASGCSPPRLATTQLPSTTGSWLAPTRTSTVQM